MSFFDDDEFDEAALAQLDAIEASASQASQAAPIAIPAAPIAASSAAPGAAPAAAPVKFPDDGGALLSSLTKYYGFDSFRGEQEKIVRAVLAGRDAAAYWATGVGKSLCYQLPALHSQKMVVVVTPLISLMQDQVVKLNNTVGRGEREIAQFLGSMQSDSSVERRALAGEFLLLYVTPEKVLRKPWSARRLQLDPPPPGPAHLSCP